MHSDIIFILEKVSSVDDFFGILPHTRISKNLQYLLTFHYVPLGCIKHELIANEFNNGKTENLGPNLQG